MSDHSGAPSSSSFAVETVPGRLSVVGITDEGLGNTAWVASLDGDVVVIDPERDPEPYLAAVENLTGGSGRELLVAETHLHADFVSRGSPNRPDRSRRHRRPDSGPVALHQPRGVEPAR